MRTGGVLKPRTLDHRGKEKLMGPDPRGGGRIFLKGEAGQGQFTQEMAMTGPTIRKNLTFKKPYRTEDSLPASKV